jgi:hypothetical protein
LPEGDRADTSFDMMTPPPDPLAEPAVPLAYAPTLAPPPPPPPPLAQPAPVIAYASGDTTGAVSKGTRVAMGLLATVYLLIAVPAVLGTIASGVANVAGSEAPIGPFLLHLPAAVIAGIYLACGVWIIRRRRWMWRALHLALAFLCVFELIVAGFGAALTIANKHATGWGGLALAIGFTLFVAASVPFLLHALTKLALLRLNVRRAFGMGDLEPYALHRAGTIAMLSLYSFVIVVGGAVFLAV